jgi:mycothiol maleylpyruvate isomerase-like protein
MALPVVDQQEACDAAEQATAAYVRLLRGVGDPAKIAIGEWSIGETAAHTAHVYETYERALEVGSFPISSTTSPTDHWAEELRKDPGRDPSAAADRIEAAAAKLWPAHRARSADEPVEWYAGLKIPAFTVPAILATEALVHGYDVAHAEVKPWPIDKAGARVSVAGLFPLLPTFVNEETARGVTACFELTLRGGPPAYLTFDNGALSIDDAAPRPVDCKLSVDATAYLLVGYGRVGQYGQALRGKIMVWGRKPWLGLKLGSLIASP